MLATAGALRPGMRVTTIPGRSLALAVSLSRDCCGHGLLACYSETVTGSEPRTQCRRRSDLNSFAARMVTDGAQWTGDTDDRLGYTEI